jgi:hypothetical protein
MDCWVQAHPNYAASHIYSLMTTQTLKAPISLHNIYTGVPLILTHEPAWPLALLSPNPQSLHSKVLPNTVAGFPSCQVKPTLLPKLSTPAMLISHDQEWSKYCRKYHPFTYAAFQSQLCDHVLCLVGSDSRVRTKNGSGNEGSAGAGSPLEWGTWILQNDPLRSLVLILRKEIGNNFLLYWMAVIHLSNVVLYSLCNISLF